MYDTEGIDRPYDTALLKRISDYAVQAYITAASAVA